MLQKVRACKDTILLSLTPKSGLALNFSLQYHPWISHQGHKNKRNDHQIKKFLIIKQILPVSILRNV